MKDKVCVITRRTDGIGKAVAYGLAMQGARVLVHDDDAAERLWQVNEQLVGIA